MSHACGSSCGSKEPQGAASAFTGTIESAEGPEFPRDPTCTIILQGEQLTDMLKAFAPLRASLTDSRLVFGRNQLLIHCWLFGEQIFWPIASTQFTTYRWVGPPAAFSTITNGKQSLLGAFKPVAQTVHRIEFFIKGQHPFRDILQRVWISEKDSTETRCVSLLKREVASFMVMVPQTQPDTCIWLTKAQMGKIWPLIPKNAFDPITFEIGTNGKFSISTTIATLSFVIQEETEPNDNTNPQLQILTSALKNANRVVDKTKMVRGANTHRPFMVRLQTGSFCDVIKRLQMGGCVFKFCISETIPTLWVTSTGPNATSVLFFLNDRAAQPPPTPFSDLPDVVVRANLEVGLADTGTTGPSLVSVSSVPLKMPPSAVGASRGPVLTPSLPTLREQTRSLNDILNPTNNGDVIRRPSSTPCHRLHDTLAKRLKGCQDLPVGPERPVSLDHRTPLTSSGVPFQVPRLVLPARTHLNTL
ncbi:DNA polymerase processivity subunit [Macropodid alphaherpesvirus 1]|uniref:DNA polymerase processivity factor n=1 Tax=Macropodid alphaherpesvirus 1 TaxID=137443 RepID=A0A0Y0C439_9ALPH|nr:DNA polymerase processivity subunit [Macropodid alphaherpesvirus 1]AMB17024.1 DNA polymerase processivity subunit [Macropodid alphaherpesvirus 1]